MPIRTDPETRQAAAHTDPETRQAAAHTDPETRQAAAHTDPEPRQAAAHTDPSSALVAQGPASLRGSSLAGTPAAPAGRPAARPAPPRPDPTSARFAVAAGGIATISALLAAIASTAVPAPAAAAVPAADGASTTGPTRTIVNYVYVQPGQAAPTAGLATVITPPAPRAVPAPVVTRQSGKP